MQPIGVLPDTPYGGGSPVGTYGYGLFGKKWRKRRRRAKQAGVKFLPGLFPRLRARRKRRLARHAAGAALKTQAMRIHALQRLLQRRRASRTLPLPGVAAEGLPEMDAGFDLATDGEATMTAADAAAMVPSAAAGPDWGRILLFGGIAIAALVGILVFKGRRKPARRPRTTGQRALA